MNNRDQIRAALIAALRGVNQNWNKLQSSLIGKELIEYGVEVIAASNDVADAMLAAYDYSSADEKSLISMSHVNNIPISFTEPTCIRIKLSGISNRTFKPFDLQATIGNSTFTNIFYYKSTDTITLYQGVVCSAFNNSVIAPFRYDTEVGWDNTTFSVDSIHTVTGHSLGNCMPESVYVFYVEHQSETAVVASLMNPFTPIIYGPEAICYKLYTSMDRSTLVLEGNGVWGQNTESFSKQIIWLSPTSNTFDPSASISLTDSTGTQITNIEVAGYTVGGESIEYARQSFRKYYLRQNAVVSKKQIKDFVNSFSYVQDSSVSILNNIVNIYIKPTDPTDNGGYGDIENELDLYGGIISNYIINNGIAIPFRFHFKTSSIVTNEASINDFITSEFAYDAMTFEQNVDTAAVSAKLQALFNAYINVALYVSNVTVASGEKFAFVPLVNTIKVISGGLTVGFDSNGYLFIERLYDSTVPIPTAFGDYSYYLGRFISYSDSLLVSPELAGSDLYTKVIDPTVIEGYLNGSGNLHHRNLFTHNGFSYIYNYESSTQTTYLQLFANYQVAESMFLSPTQPLSGQLPKIIGPTTNFLVKSTTKIPLYYKGLYYIISVEPNSIKLEHYTGDNHTPYFVYNITSTGKTLLNVYVGDDALYLVCAGGNTGNPVIYIKDFNSPQPSWYILNIANPTGVSGTLVGFHAFDSTHCAAVFTNGSTSYIVKSTGLLQAGSNIELSAPQIISDSITLSSASSTFLYCTDSWVMLQDGTVTKVYFDDTVKTASDVSSIVSTYILDNNCSAGSVNYSDGTVVYNTNLLSTSSGMTFSYDAIVFNRDKSNYLVLDTNNPIVWN